jgi:prepilin-type N-terminal cleavage/methylation domain-containing protein
LITYFTENPLEKPCFKTYEQWFLVVLSDRYYTLVPHGIAFAPITRDINEFIAFFKPDPFQREIMKAFERQKKNVSGFSLMEVMVVICMIGILAAIAIPTYSSWVPDYRLRKAARDLYSNFQRAKMGAIRNNAEWRIYFDNSISPGRYFLCSDNGGDGWDTPTTLGGNDVVEMTFNLSDFEGVDYGNGDAGSQITGFGSGDTFGSAIDFETGMANFTPRGTVDLRGFVYLTNVKGTCYAVGTPSPAGVIILRKWLSGTWQ